MLTPDNVTRLLLSMFMKKKEEEEIMISVGHFSYHNIIGKYSSAQRAEALFLNKA